MAKVEAAVPKTEKIGGIDKWEVENALETLLKAKEIEHNPKLMAALAPLLKKKRKAIESLDDLRARAREEPAETEPKSDAE
jgi:hypothetical protein